MTNALISKTYNNLTFTFRGDGYFNMTKAAQHFGKRLQNFMDNAETKTYITALENLNHSKESDKEITKVQRGNGNLPSVGTWAHPKLAVFFARWLDVRFAVWCDSMIEDILKVPTNFREALLLAAAQQVQLEVAHAKLAEAAPKVDVFDTLVADKNMTLQDYVRTLPDVKQTTIARDLIRLGNLYKTKEGNKTTKNAILIPIDRILLPLFTQGSTC